MFGTQKRPGKARIDYPPPIFIGQFGNGYIFGDGGIVDQEMNLLIFSKRFPNHCPDRILVSNIRLQKEGIRTVEETECFLAKRVILLCHDDMSPGIEKKTGDAQADPPPPAGHHGCFVFEKIPVHARFISGPAGKLQKILDRKVPIVYNPGSKPESGQDQKLPVCGLDERMNMNKNSERFLQALLEAPSPSGFEQPAAKIWRQHVKSHVDQLIPDVHGNSIAVLNPDAKFKFMLAGHVDEIGLMITHIDEKGYIYTAQIGGMDPSLLIGQRVKIITSKGPILGVIGRKAIHQMKPDERKKGVEMENIWVDIGAANKKDALKRVAIGDPIVIDVLYRRLNSDKVVSRATDDKAGAFVVAEVMRALSKRKLKISVIGVATVQEEIGLRGAITSAYQVHPQAGIAVDVGFSSDHPDTDPKKTGEVAVGKGPVLHRGPNINPILEKALFKVAKEKKIPTQISAEPRGTGTDANAIQLCRGGAATALVSIPNRYMHTPVEVISLKDLDHGVKLLTEFLASHPAERDYRP